MKIIIELGWGQLVVRPGERMDGKGTICYWLLSHSVFFI